MGAIKNFFGFFWNIFVSFGTFRIERQEKIIEKFTGAKTEEEKKAAVAEFSESNF